MHILTQRICGHSPKRSNKAMGVNTEYDESNFSKNCNASYCMILKIIKKIYSSSNTSEYEILYFRHL